MRLSAFAASMPEAYRSAFAPGAVEKHAAVVLRRAKRPVVAHVWEELDQDVLAVCVVADDRPGLLSLITSALVSRDIDVVRADAYCRTRADGVVEAVDFLWIRRWSGAALTTRDVVAVEDLLGQLISGSPDAAAIAAELSARSVKTRPIAGGGARVRFAKEEHRGVTVLTIEAVDRPGLLSVVTRTLFASNVQIVGLRATTEKGHAVDRFELAETDGRPLANARLLELQSAVLGAIDESWRAETA